MQQALTVNEAALTAVGKSVGKSLGLIQSLNFKNILNLNLNFKICQTQEQNANI